MTAPRLHPFVRLILCALGLLAIVVGVLAVLAVAVAISTVYRGRAPAEPLEEIAERYRLLLTVLLSPLMLGWIWLCRNQFDCRSWASLGFRRRRALPDLVRGALTGALSIGLLWSILWLTGAISVAGWSSDVAGDASRAILPLLGYAGVFIAVGFFEETLFRGYILHNLASWFGWKGAVGAQAALFALVHLGNVQGGSSESVQAALGALPSLFLIAVFFALCARKTGSLWFPIGFHFAWNFCLGPVLSLPVSGIPTFHLLEVKVNQVSWLSGGSFGAEGSWLLIPIIGALIYFISLAPDHPQAILDLEPLAVAPRPVAPPEEEEKEEPRENRYGTKFGSAQGFSADTLLELRALQEERERAQREDAESAKRERIEAELAAPAPISAVAVAPVVVALVFEPQEVRAEVVVKPTEVETRKEEVVAVEKIASPVVVEKPIEKPAVKKPSQRW